MKTLKRPSAETAVAPRFLLEEIRSDLADESFADAVAAGLDVRPRSLPCRFFYDERGSLLFEEITQLDEYYPTRVERSILAGNAKAIAQSIGPDPELLELGSGSAAKTRLLIAALIAEHGSLLFRPVDISPTILESSSRQLIEDHPELSVHAVAAEYDAALRRLANAEARSSRLVAWLGSSIGNLPRNEAAAFLGRVGSVLRPQDRMLVGIDRRKDTRVLERAYDDDRGVTAAFNLNLLERANRELGSDFDLDQFEHRAIWRDDRGRVEMHLVSRRAQTVRIGELDASYDFEAGETIHTENCHKYSRDEIDELAERAGLRVVDRWNDPEELFEVSLMQAA